MIIMILHAGSTCTEKAGHTDTKISINILKFKKKKKLVNYKLMNNLEEIQHISCLLKRWEVQRSKKANKRTPDAKQVVLVRTTVNTFFIKSYTFTAPIIMPSPQKCK